MRVKENLELMKTLDDAWNAGPGSLEWERFRKRHTENVAVYCARVGLIRCTPSYAREKFPQ